MVMKYNTTCDNSISAKNNRPPNSSVMPPIKYNGVSQDFPENPMYFTQISIPETLVIPNAKPDIEHLVSVTVEVELESLRIIDTPSMESFEGQFLSGKKLIVELKLTEKVVYAADEPNQSVHGAHWEETFKSAFIIVPETMNGEAVEDILQQGNLIVTPYIEDIYAEKINTRTIFKNITMLLDAVTACSC